VVLSGSAGSALPVSQQRIGPPRRLTTTVRTDRRAGIVGYLVGSFVECFVGCFVE